MNDAKQNFLTQSTFWDCVPICFENALRLYFTRSEINVAALKMIWTHSLDIKESGYGTSYAGLYHITQNLALYSKGRFRVQTEFLEGEDIPEFEELEDFVLNGGCIIVLIQGDDEGSKLNHCLLMLDAYQVEDSMDEIEEQSKGQQSMGAQSKGIAKSMAREPVDKPKSDQQMGYYFFDPLNRNNIKGLHNKVQSLETDYYSANLRITKEHFLQTQGRFTLGPVSDRLLIKVWRG